MDFLKRSPLFPIKIIRKLQKFKGNELQSDNNNKPQGKQLQFGSEKFKGASRT